MDFLELSKARFSVRKFNDKPIEREKLARILEVGNIAPTAKNNQPQRIYVIQGEDALAKVNAITPCIYGAKTVLMFAYNADEDWKNPKQSEKHSGEQDVSIVATHIMLEAWDLGIGSCWVNFFANDELEKAFNLPKNEKTVLLMPLGYADANVKPAPQHSNKKPLFDTIKYL